MTAVAPVRGGWNGASRSAAAPAGSLEGHRNHQRMARPSASSSSASSTASVSSYPGEIIEERERHTGEVRCYEKGRFLGKGGFAKVYAFKECSTGQKFAAKVISKASIQKPRHLAKLKAEISIHRSLRHPGIVGFERYFEDRENVYILLELCNHRSMMELMRRRKRLGEPEARFYTRQITDALMYMHRRRVIHRDLKLGNVFVNNMQVKLGDFGLAAKLSHDGERKRTVCGTPNYIAPEILAGGEAGHSYEVDAWSLGVLVYTLVVGTPPFETHDVKATYERIRNNTWGFPSQAECPLSSAVKDIVRRMLNPDPSQRLTLAEVAKHEWFTENATPTRLPESALTEPISRETMAQLCATPFARTVNAGSQHTGRSPLAVRDMNSPTPRGGAGDGKKENFAANNMFGGGGAPSPAAGQTHRATESARPALNMFAAANSASANPFRSDNHNNNNNNNNVQAPQQHRGQSLRATAESLSSHKRRAAIHGQEEPRAGRKFARTGERDQQDQQDQEAIQADAYQRRLQELIAQTPSAAAEQQQQQQQQQQQLVQVPIALSSGAVVASPTRRLDANIEELRVNILDACSGQPRRAFRDSTDARLVRALVPGLDGQPPAITAHSGDSLATVWVYVWVDCSKRYGLGYQSTAGVFGGYFNDRSKMTLADDEVLWYHQNVDGVSHSVQMLANDDPAAVQEQHGLEMQLPKKNTLIRYFRSYLRDHHKRGTEISQGDIRSEDPAAQVFVMRWVRTKNAIAFRLSHGGVQVNFFDHTKLMIWSGEGNAEAPNGHTAFCYVDASAQRTVFSLSDPEVQTNEELLHRLRYAADSIIPALTRRHSTVA
jgi:serine/threonine protein kinase